MGGQVALKFTRIPFKIEQCEDLGLKMTMTTKTQKEKVLRRILSVGDGSRWWFPYEFIEWDGEFIGYKAPTRFSELCLELPELLESKREGKYKVGRLRAERFKEVDFIKKLPERIWPIVREYAPELVIRRQVPVFTDRGTVRLEWRAEKITNNKNTQNDKSKKTE